MSTEKPPGPSRTVLTPVPRSPALNWLASNFSSVVQVPTRSAKILHFRRGFWRGHLGAADFLDLSSAARQIKNQAARIRVTGAIFISLPICEICVYCLTSCEAIQEDNQPPMNSDARRS